MKSKEKKNTYHTPFVGFYSRVRKEHLERLAARAKRERKSQGEVVRELFEKYL